MDKTVKNVEEGNVEHPKEKPEENEENLFSALASVNCVVFSESSSMTQFLTRYLKSKNSRSHNLRLSYGIVLVTA